MGSGVGKRIRRALLSCVLSICALAAAAAPAVSADYPRRVAIAPFSSLAKEDIQQTVSVLPRLLSSRLMALAGAEVTLLPAGEKSAAASAREANIPILLHGTVAKLGKGYSIDVTALDPATGKTANAFFAAAASEDEIIPQLGVLAAEIAEKLFGIKTIVRAAPVVTPQAYPAPQLPGTSLPSHPAAGAAAVAPYPSAQTAPPVAPSGPWEPRSIVKVSASDKIADELYRVGSGDLDGDGSPEVAAIGSRKLWVYKVNADNVLPFRKLERNNSHLFLNVETADVDGDGKAEIVVTDLVGDRLKSFVVKYKGEGLETVAPEIPYYIISLEDGKGNRRLIGQARGVTEPYSGKIVYLKWNGKTLVPDGTVPTTVESGIFGLAALPGDADNRFLYIDSDEHIRLVDPKGKTVYKTKEYYSGAVQLFTWGMDTRSNVGPDRHYIRGRIHPVSMEGKSTVFLVRQAKGNMLFRDVRTFDWSRLVFLSWGGDGFSEKGASERIDNLMSDFAVLGGKAGSGSRVAVSVIESSASYASESLSRIHLYRLD
jgi:hypothetical protein